ncbi:MAG TPA: FliH/SctL family protein [Bacteroidota bacterium]|nr:FliH/SctL family protein [Bacteroidota bacterium]
MSNVLKLKTPAIRIVPHHPEHRREPFPDLDTILVEEEKTALFEKNKEQQVEQTSVVEDSHSQSPWQDMTVVIAAAQKESYEQGYAQAMKDREEHYANRLREECLQTIKPQREQMNQVVAGVQNAWKQFSDSVENVVVTLSLAAAERVIKKEVQNDDRLILNQIREGLRRITGVEHLKLRLHPDDEKIVRQSRTELLANVDSVRDIVVEPDETVSRGGCIIESESGSVDATVETQTKKMAELLTEARALFK